MRRWHDSAQSASFQFDDRLPSERERSITPSRRTSAADPRSSLRGRVWDIGATGKFMLCMCNVNVKFEAEHLLRNK